MANSRLPVLQLGHVLLMLLHVLSNSIAFHMQFEDGKLQLKMGGSLIPEFKLEIKTPALLEGLGFGNVVESFDAAAAEEFNQLDPGANDTAVQKSKDISCIRLTWNLLRDGLPHINACLRNMEFDIWDIWNLPKRIREFFPCMLKCLGQRIGIFEEDGTVNLMSAMEVLTEGTPERLQGVAMKIGAACFEQIGNLRANDTSCTSHGELLSCVVRNAFKQTPEILDVCSEIPQGIKTFIKKISNTTQALLG